VCAIFALRAGELVEMDEQPFAAEKDLQRNLEAHPELLSAEAAEDDRRRWLLVRREMGVADQDDAADRWSLDHLFVDQDAIPTFVEVKRSSNTEIRRKVVGPMLDYAANASAHWDAGRLRSSFESRFVHGGSKRRGYRSRIARAALARKATALVVPDGHARRVPELPRALSGRTAACPV